MTPYSVMVTANEDITIDKFYKQNSELNFSRIPILNKNKIESYVLKDTILESIIASPVIAIPTFGSRE